ncbi:uncharacterized protein LOC143280662 [Babylonia areolata]|uniref:uncharacterized protein LOC143280662 n=1 Tax=Babylonia areolata TaxID=304850 RepID=UPI003FD2C184
MMKTSPVPRLSRSTSLYEASPSRRSLYFQRHSRMGGRGEGESEAIAFIHAADAASWAIFLQNKLRSDNYRILSHLHHEPNHNSIPDLFSGNQTCVVLVSPCLLEPQNSVFWSRCGERFNHRTLIIFLGVTHDELRQNLGTTICALVLSHQWLFVDGSKEAVSNALIKLIEVYESSVCSSGLDVCGEGDGEGEDGDGEMDDVYDTPPRPRQLNSVMRVMPEVIYENDGRDVWVLMEREADGTLTMVTESDSGPSRHIFMKRVVASLYLATLPSDLVGKVDFMILSEDEHNLGSGTFRVRTAMDQLRCLLEKESSPMTVLCKAMGVSGSRLSEMEEMDKMLAKRLAFSQFPKGLTNVLQPDDQSAGDQASSQWPTLLHFAAEFNLTQVCEELLCYPGMIHAACMENCDGAFPCQLAEKNGFSALQKRLVQFVEDMRLRRSAADSGISFSENLPPPPSPHTSTGPYYVNERPPSVDLQTADDDDDNDYMAMSPPPSCHGALSSYVEVADVWKSEVENQQAEQAPTPCWRKGNDGYAKPRSYSEGCVKTPYAKTPSEARIAEEDISENDPPSLTPKVGRTRSAASAFLPQARPCTSHKPPGSNSSSQEAADSQEGQPEESTSKSSTETLTLSEPGATCGSEQESEETGEEQRAPVSFSLGLSSERPASQASSISSQSDHEVPLSHPEAPHDGQPVLRVSGKGKRSKSVQDKISHFFRKIKPSRRLHSASDSELPVKGHKKAVVYSRQSTTSTNSDTSDYRSSSTLGLKGSEGERDSGAVCDDNTPVTMRSKGKDSIGSRFSGKRNAVTMQRRASVRVQRAKREDLTETPTLPARKSGAEAKETFVSFINCDD